jgi:CrcB protein
LKLLLVAGGGSIGALLRYAISTLIPGLSLWKSGLFPLGTLLVNTVASFCIGILLGIDYQGFLSSRAKLLLGTGFCGGLSTFSTFAAETLELLGEKQYLLFGLNVLLNNILTIGFVFLGLVSARWVWGRA